MNTLLKMLYSPVEAFRDLKNTEKFPAMSLILLLIIVIINNILMIPVTAKVAEITYANMALPISDEQIETALNMLHKLRYLQVGGAVFSYLFMLVVYTLIIWVFTKIAKLTLSFQKASALIIHCCLVFALGALVNTFILYFQGIEKIDNMYEISLTGLNLLTSTESVGVTFYTFLTLINPFYFWFLILLTVGVAIFTETTYVKSFIVSFLFWAILIGFPVLTMYFTQILFHNKGLF
jgi:hypothetical protein